jgi:hypothetical protein
MCWPHDLEAAKEKMSATKPVTDEIDSNSPEPRNGSLLHEFCFYPPKSGLWPPAAALTPPPLHAAAPPLFDFFDFAAVWELLLDDPADVMAPMSVRCGERRRSLPWIPSLQKPTNCSKLSLRILFWNRRIVAETKLKKMEAMRASDANQLFASVRGHHPIIAQADFGALLTFEELHPNLFHRNRTMPSEAALAVADDLAAGLSESCAHVESGWIEEAAFQIDAFNLVFHDPAHSPEFKQIVKMMSEILRTGHWLNLSRNFKEGIRWDTGSALLCWNFVWTARIMNQQVIKQNLWSWLHPMNAALPDTPPGLASSFEHFTCLFGATVLSYDASQVESVFTKLLLRHIQSKSTWEGL